MELDEEIIRSLPRDQTVMVKSHVTPPEYSGGVPTWRFIGLPCLPYLSRLPRLCPMAPPCVLNPPVRGGPAEASPSGDGASRTAFEILVKIA